MAFFVVFVLGGGLFTWGSSSLLSSGGGGGGGRFTYSFVRLESQVGLQGVGLQFGVSFGFSGCLLLVVFVRGAGGGGGGLNPTKAKCPLNPRTKQQTP